METEPIAIVGVGCRLPGSVHSLDEASAVFEEGRDCIGEIPPERWDVDHYYHPDPLESGKTYVRHSGFVDHVDRFDAGFFGIPDMEAAHMDPQQRMLLETAWHALEHAGQNPQELMGSNTGVFLALMAMDYVHLKNTRSGLEGITSYEGMSDTQSISAGRLAHFFGLEGPCMTVDTACSGSLVALHMARQSLLTGECDAAVVAGANAILAPNGHIMFSKMGLFSRAGQCRAFDADADGYVRSEGCVVALLRRQSEAEKRGDRILASIVGSATNHGGRSRTLTSPNGRSQERVIRTALSAAGVDPAQVGYVEAHGTGTPVGDPIEMNAIAGVYGSAHPADQPLYVSSGKSAMGHTEAAAGLVGVIRAALSLDRQTIYPSLHMDRLNPKIDLAGVPIQIPTEPVDWPRSERPRIAAVNSFGYSGTNAHALLREAPASQPLPQTGRRPEELLVLSAKSTESLEELAARWADFLSHTKSGALPEAVFTAAAGRAPLRHRLAVTGKNGTDLANSLRMWRTSRAPATLTAGRAKKAVKTAWVFSGQGTQYPGMARGLYGQEPVFAAAIDRCAELMDEGLGVPLRQVLFEEESPQTLQDTRLAQPALFAVEYALAELLLSWGVEPSALIGHSIGEVVAACVGGVLTLQDAARFAVLRGRLMGELPGGGKMLAVTADEETVRGWLAGREDEAAIAALNGPRAIVVAGTAEALTEIAALAEGARAEISWLRTSHAFHSPLMDPALPELHKAAAGFQPGNPRLPVTSGVTGQLLTGDEGPEHWTSQARQPVRFHDGIRAALAAGCTVFVEVGPHPSLIRHIADAAGGVDVTPVAMLKQDGRDVRNVLGAAGALFTAGAAIDLAALYQGPQYRRTSAAPQYPFRRDRYWVGEQPEASVRPTAPSVPAPRSETSVHEHRLAAASPWSDHRVHGATVFPAAGYLELVVRAHAEGAAGGTYPVALTDVRFTRPLVLGFGKTESVLLSLSGPDGAAGGPRTFVFSTSGGTGRLPEFSTGVVASAPALGQGGRTPEELRAAMPTALAPTQLYGKLRADGLEHGFHFATVRELWLGEPGSDQALARITAAPDGASGDGHSHRLATMFDGCLQLAAALFLTPGADLRQGGYVPYGIARMVLGGPLPDQIWARVRRRPHASGTAFVVDARVTDDKGAIVADFEGIEFRYTGAMAGASAPAEEGTTQRTGRTRQELLDVLAPLPHQERRKVVTVWLAEEVMDTLGRASAELDLDVNGIDPSLALLEIGLDSLKVTELQRRLQEKLEFRFKAMEGLDYQTVEGLADYLLDQVINLEPA